MAQDSPLSGEPSKERKLELARSGARMGGETRLEVLIALAGDADEEIRRTAQYAIESLSDAECSRLLSAPVLDSAIPRYFLDQSNFRRVLLPALLDHPSTPPDALAALAAVADSDLISQFLSHLDKLSTQVLVALKENPLYLDWQKRAQASTTARFRGLAGDTLRETDKTAGQQELAGLITLAAGSDPEAARGAQETLNGLADQECLNLLAAVNLDETVARYYLTPPNIRPALLPLLLGHPGTPPDAITALAGSAGPDLVSILLDQLDLLKTPALLALKANPTYLEWQHAPPQQGYVLEVDLLDLLIQEMESEKPPSVEELEAAFADSGVSGGEEAGGGLVNKVARMKVSQRVKLALLGTREERSLLIRDTSRVVFRAVLSSPKLTEADVESFSSLKNVNQEVLRLISLNRKFIKNYTVCRNLANNPRTPIDVSLPLLNRLLPNDLRAISGSRDVPDTLRKMAKKLIQARSS